MSYADGYAFNQVSERKLPPTHLEMRAGPSLTDKLLELKELCKTIENNVKKENFSGVAANKKEDKLKMRLGAYLAGRKLTGEELSLLGVG